MKPRVSPPVAAPAGEAGEARRWQIDLALVLWPSFLMAALATSAFFATFDPLELYEHAQVLRAAFAPRAAAYTIGFFFFWANAAAAGAITLWLARTAATPRPSGRS